MLTIIVSDIFGRTAALEKLALSISSNSFIIDPYQGRKMNFASEQCAYSEFTKSLGLNQYSKCLSELLLTVKQPIRLIGFSVGAAAIWNVSNQKFQAPYQLYEVKRAICFYGAQIRHNTNIQPAFPMELIFPKHENHFCLPKLIKTLSNTSQVSIRQVPYLHGFMNSHSTHFNKQAYESEIQILNKENSHTK